ncbi:tRNA nuclease WapA [Pedobacter sp. Bi27]|uniref:DUF6443 domain-containing protein n=1 Tax=unclassified Pedobacter TaxID=2628915 RepID=UPI001D9CD1AA|nr:MULTISPECIES: DUF6443 domain-containing protein [unclassified Pedobacter]CAH0277110.1 tRNA nuclease WapA [Pedobacter sp. Bi36]CAH0294962.1 tRNA nuclease WapA [Pedobacter sp. Bi126]CAH0312060.1 tRNA nuclease WapA [Pedobacter sp. Bi27]
MKQHLKYFCAAAFLLLCSRSSAQKVVSVYNGESEISAPLSVTLTDGFHTTGSVRIFTTGLSYINCVPFVSAASNGQNYISTRIFKQPGMDPNNLSGRSICEVNETIQYFDGLGRPLQTIQVQGSPGFKDIVQPVAYDAFGREAIKYQPYAALTGTTGNYRSGALTDQAGFYNSPTGGIKATAYPFAETVFEASPLNRVLQQGAPGEDWQISGGHTVKAAYGTNLENEVKLWIINGTDNGAAATVYPQSKLYKTTSKDENWVPGDLKAGTTDEFKDFEGRVVLKRVWEADGKSLNTYYVYDDLGNLRYVLPPAVNENGQAALNSFDETQIVFDQFIYGYRYDGRRRLVEKKVPGKGWEYLVYNKLDQVTHTQDANQRALSQWSWIKYDALGRVILTGVENGQGINRPGMQTYNDGVSIQWEDRTSATAEGYSHNTHPEVGEEYANVEFLNMNYYDDYNFPGYTSAYAASVGVSTRTRGLTTGSFVRILGTAIKLLTVTYYDEDGRVKETISDNRLGGKDRTVNNYNFASELTSSVRTHEANGAVTTVLSGYSYDHIGRKVQTYKQINNGSVTGVNELLSEYVYNEIGQLTQKKLHNGMQVTAMAYNERGWLKSSISNEFSIQLGYQENGENQYNGNISKQFWSQNASPATSPNVFSYNYDALNRLTNGTSTGIYMSEVLNYDNMGNINQLSRNGGAMNQYYYNGNRLDRVDNVAGTYSYDANGNATTDGRNGMNLTYNLLNLPSGASGNGKVIQYVYDASGDKLRKVAIENSLTTTREYIDGIEYEGSNIDIIHTEEGVAQRNGDNSYSYHYNLSDHLGNVRYTFDIYNNQIRQLQVDNYYPFGKRNNAVFGNNKYLYNGKEVQDELGEQYDYGARFYDPVIGRFTTMDPHSEKYFMLSPYAYVANNPLKYIDPDGKDIIIAKADRAKVLGYINSLSSGKFGVNSQGKLYAMESKSSVGKSDYYRDKLVAAIKDPDLISIKIASTFTDRNGQAKSVDLVAGGGVTQSGVMTKKDASGKVVSTTKVAEVTISDNPNQMIKDTNGQILRDNPADILAHELVGHAIPIITKTDTGNAVSNENKVRKQLLPGQNKERQADPNHKEN